MGQRVSAVALLARRFLLSKSSDGFISLISWVSVLGVMLGVLALTVVTSVINGFEGELENIISGMNGDIVLYSRGDPFNDADVIEHKIRRIVPETRAISQSFVSELMVSGSIGVAGAVLEGVDRSMIGQVTVIPKRFVEGRMPAADGEVALTSVLAERIGAKVGDEVRLIIPYAGQLARPDEEDGKRRGRDARDSDAFTPKSVTVKVVGLARMGLYEYDSKFMFATLESVQKLMSQPGKITSLKIRLVPRTDSSEVSDRLAKSFGYPFRAKNWAQLNKNLLYAIKLEKVVIGILLTVIVIVAAFNVMSTLMMMIHDKSREIAILKAMGLRPGQGFRLFAVIGLGMGTVGALFGIAMGLAVNWVIERTRIIDLPADIYYISFLPVVIRWGEVGMIALMALVISLLATLYPGWKAARRSPIEGLRYD